ncbi:MAG TPA: ABC transporter permease [Polyangia bacterium]|jgi:ABC-2 type transport system permease protein|nr:ABC transporter permease [Polyangia bacterium]
MSAVLLIARRELGGYFRSMTGYIIAALVLLIDGLLFNAFVLSAGEMFSADVLSNFFYISFGTTVIASVFISMRLLAEERQTGTLVLLTSSPVHDWEIVIGKYLSALAFLAIITLATVYIPALILVNGKVSVGHLASGYLGLLLVGSATLAIGVFGSALARTQVLAAIISGVIVVSILIAHLVSRVTDRPLKDMFMALALYARHFPPFQSGAIHLRDVVYYVVVAYVALFAAIRVMEARRWK